VQLQGSKGFKKRQLQGRKGFRKKELKDVKKKIKCDFTSVNLQLEHRTIGCKISRDNLSLDTADELFAGHRLTGTVEVVRENEAEGQDKLFEGSVSSVKAVFDVKKFSVRPEEFGCTLIFAKDDIDPVILDGFLKKSGTITVSKSGSLPEKTKDDEA